MTLIAGTKLGPYKILAAIGAGGMGEVYRATDTKLRRDVAIKILPELFAADPERVARFSQPARPHVAEIATVQRLRHPADDDSVVWRKERAGSTDGTRFASAGSRCRSCFPAALRLSRST